MAPKYLAALIACWAVTFVTVRSADLVMTWQVSSNKEHTIKFKMDVFQEFSDCMCDTMTYTCDLFANSSGFARFYQQEPLPSGAEAQRYTNSYICEQYSAATLVRCKRRNTTDCVGDVKCWPHSVNAAPDSCPLGQLTFSWINAQVFSMTSYDTGALVIPACDTSCPSNPTTGLTTELPTTTSTESTSTSSPCQDRSCSPSTSEPSRSTSEPSAESSTKAPPTSSTVPGNATANGVDGNTSDSGSGDTATVIGVVVGVVVVAVLVAVGLLFWWRRRNSRKKKKYGGNQLPSAEMVNGGCNGVGRHSGSRGGDTTYVNVAGDQAKPNGTNADYYNLRNGAAHFRDTATSAYEVTGDSASAAERSDDYVNARRPGQDVDGYEEPVSARVAKVQSQLYSNMPVKQTEGDGLVYEDVDRSPDPHSQTSRGYGRQTSQDKMDYEAPVNQRGGHASENNIRATVDGRTALRSPSPAPENVYSEVTENVFASKKDLDDIVPPKRNRFSEPLSQTDPSSSDQSSVYELAKPINNNADGITPANVQSSGPSSRLNAHSSTPVNPHNNEEGSGTDTNFYDSGSPMYFELESRASIRVRDTDSQEDPIYSSAEPRTYPYGVQGPACMAEDKAEE